MTHDFIFTNKKEFERTKSHEHTRIRMMNSVNKSSSHTFLPTTSPRRHKDNNFYINGVDLMRSLLQGGSRPSLTDQKLGNGSLRSLAAPAAVPPTLAPARPSPRFQRAPAPVPGPLHSPRLRCLASISFSSANIPASRACVRNACLGRPQHGTASPDVLPAPPPDRPSAPSRSRRPPRDCAPGPERGQSPDGPAPQPTPPRLGSQGQTRPEGVGCPPLGCPPPPAGASRDDALASGCGPLPHGAKSFVHCLLTPRESLSFWVTPPQGKGGWRRSQWKGKGHFLLSLTQLLDTQRHLSSHVLLWVSKLEGAEDFIKAFPGHLLCYMLDHLKSSSSSVRSSQQSGRQGLPPAQYRWGN